MSTERRALDLAIPLTNATNVQPPIHAGRHSLHDKQGREIGHIDVELEEPSALRVRAIAWDPSKTDEAGARAALERWLKGEPA